MPSFQSICQTTDIPKGEARMFVVEETPVGVFHIDDNFFALHNECPHSGASLAHGFVECEP